MCIVITKVNFAEPNTGKYVAYVCVNKIITWFLGSVQIDRFHPNVDSYITPLTFLSLSISSFSNPHTSVNVM